MTQTRPRQARRAVIYARISDDRTGHGAGVARQHKECQALADREGMTVVGVFTDNSRSAFHGARPEYERMLATIERGGVDVVVVWATDRLYRRLADLLPLTDLLGRHGVVVHTVKGGDVDLATADGQLRANIMGAVAQHESQRRGERVQAAALQRAAAGRFGGGKRRFGYRHTDGDGSPLTLEPVEADALRWAYTYVHDGGSLEAVVREWRARGLTGTQGAEFTGVTARDALLRPLNAGLATYRGEVVGRSTAPAIVDEETFTAVRAILTDPKRRTTVGRPPTSLLAGLLRCGVCGGRVSARNRIGSGGQRRSKIAIYACREAHTSRQRDRMDEAMSDAVLGRLEAQSSRLRKPSHTETGAVREALREAERLRSKLSDLAALLDADELSPLDYARATKAARERLAEVESRVVISSGTPASTALVQSADVRSAWEALDVAERRTILREQIHRVTITPRPSAGRFSMEGTEILWK
jgi:DNA invertase Pin-like site-specific DNA recombinase